MRKGDRWWQWVTRRNKTDFLKSSGINIQYTKRDKVRWRNRGGTLNTDHAAMMAEMKSSLGLTFNRHFLFFTNKGITSDADWELQVLYDQIFICFSYNKRASILGILIFLGGIFSFYFKMFNNTKFPHKTIYLGTEN